MADKKFYVTTPIYYVTAKPHLGSLYSTILADVVARWQRLNGKKVFFVTGTDEHGQKVAQAAHQAGKEPKAFVDSFIPAYKQTWETYDIKYDTFIRTTDASHVKGVQAFVKKLIEHDAVYKDQYEGWYCVPCETFVTEKAEGEQAPIHSFCGRKTEKFTEKTYFFRLSAYQDKLLQFYNDNPDFITPKERANEVISFVRSGLKDLSISRTTIRWGIPFPDDPEHTIYVWADALCNYITAIGYPENEQLFNAWWPADLHIVGKDIARFHAVYWPAFLMAAGLPLPRRLLVHGWITVDKQKMSKSFGNVVDPMLLNERYGAEVVRYYLMRKIPVNQDSDFGAADVEQVIESDLANELGNLLQRMVTVAHKNNLIEVEAPKVWSEASLQLRGHAWDMIEDFESYMNDYMFHLALARLWKFINQVNAYFHELEPWKIAPKNQALFEEIISATAHSLRTMGILLWPVMPNKMEQLLDSLGIVFEPKNNSLEKLELGSWRQRFVLKKIPILFKKIEVVPQKETTQGEEKKPMEDMHYITIEDVAKVELLVGTITACEPVEKSDKLLKLNVDFGQKGTRQILAGIKKFFLPSDLMGKQGIFVYNLNPRKMLNLESQGMMLLAQDENGNPQLTTVAVPVPNGTRLK
ncbi:MAG: methionine--tRNA ligase [bacterium]|nr:methionine--tRNA ligase [bacterium]